MNMALGCFDVLHESQNPRIYVIMGEEEKLAQNYVIAREEEKLAQNYVIMRREEKLARFKLPITPMVKSRSEDTWFRFTSLVSRRSAVILSLSSSRPSQFSICLRVWVRLCVRVWVYVYMSCVCEAEVVCVC